MSYLTKENMMSVTLDGFRHRMVRVGEVNIHAVVGGDGPPIVLLHGFPQTWWEWRKMISLLATKHTVVAVDLRGAGHSDSPQGGGAAGPLVCRRRFRSMPHLLEVPRLANQGLRTRSADARKLTRSISREARPVL